MQSRLRPARRHAAEPAQPGGYFSEAQGAVCALRPPFWGEASEATPPRTARCTGVKETKCFSLFRCIALRCAQPYAEGRMSTQRALVEQLLRRLSDAIEGPAGPIPLDRALRKNPDILCQLRGTGMTWAQIASLAEGAGIKGRQGQSIRAPQWRAMASRAGREAVRHFRSPSQVHAGPRPVVPIQPAAARRGSTTTVSASSSDAVRDRLNRLVALRKTCD